MIFRRKKSEPEATLTNQAFGWWLRAGRPQPLAWFLRQAPQDQECMAVLGDEYNMGISMAIQDSLTPPIPPMPAPPRGGGAFDDVEMNGDAKVLFGRGPDG